MVLAAALAIAAPQSRADEIFLCSGGTFDGENCVLDSDCPDGACAAALAVCLGGARDAERCDCPGSTCEGSTCAGGVRQGESCGCSGGNCEPTVSFCPLTSPGGRAGAPCLSNAQCGDSTCAPTGRYCWGGSEFKFACLQNTDCESGGSNGTCTAPGIAVDVTNICSKGSNNGGPCTSNSQCPGGACVIGDVLCAGATTPHDCESDTDCEPQSPCTLTQKVCDGGFTGQYCVDSSTCGGGQCLSTGKYCNGGRNFACVDDTDCTDNGSCVAGGVGLPEPTLTPTSTPVPSSDDDGCAINPNASASGSGLLLAVAALAGLLRLRRR